MRAESPRSEPVPAGASFPRPVGSFVGRRAELDRIHEHLEDEVLFLVYGVGGIGKSELVYRLAHELRDHPEWRAARPVHVEVHAGSTTSHVLARLLAAAGAPPAPRQGRRTADAHSLEQLGALSRLLDARPCLLFIDDAHHLPAEPVAEALSYLARHVRQSRIFVASRRQIPLPPDAPPPVVTTLGPLPPPDAERMVHALAERLELSGADLAAVTRAAHGSPFHLRRALAGARSPDEGALADSLRALSPAASRALLAVATAPQRPSLDALRRALPAIDEAIAELSARFLLDVVGERASVHDLVREALLRLASAEDRAAARVDAAALCVEELRDGRATTLLSAVDAVGLLIGAERFEPAYELVERFGPALAAAGLDHLLTEPLAQLREVLPARRVAIDLLVARGLVRASAIDDAHDVLSRIDGARTAAEEERRLLLAGEIAQRRGELSEAEARFREAAERAPDEAARLSARLAMALVAAHRGEGERARSLLDAALTSLDAPTPRQRARLAHARAVSWMLDERFEQGADEALRARLALPAAGHEDLASRLAMLETLAAIECDDMARARAATKLIDERGLRRPVATLYRAIAAYAGGEARAASEALLASHEYLSSHDDAFNAYIAAYFGSAALAEIGRLAEARTLSRHAARLAERAGLRSLVARSLAQQAVLAAEALECPLAHRLADEALACHGGGPRTHARALTAHARASTIEGDVARALERVAEARAAVAGLPSAHAAIDVEAAAVELVGGELDGAIERAERVAAHYRDRTREYEAARAWLVLAAAYVARGRRTDLVRAERAVVEAREVATRCELRSIQVGCAILGAALARGRDRSAAADALLADALLELDPERGSVYASTLTAAIEGAAAARIAPGAVALLARLGFRDAVDCYLVDRWGRRAASRGEVARERAARELVADELDATITACGGAHEIRGPTLTALLSVLVQAQGEAVSPETLYRRVWSAAEYHPLKNRNALYVAINRLRQGLRAPFPDRVIIERASAGWRLADGVDASAAVPARPSGA